MPRRQKRSRDYVSSNTESESDVSQEESVSSEDSIVEMEVSPKKKSGSKKGGRSSKDRSHSRDTTGSSNNRRHRSRRGRKSRKVEREHIISDNSGDEETTTAAAAPAAPVAAAAVAAAPLAAPVAAAPVAAAPAVPTAAAAAAAAINPHVQGFGVNAGMAVPSAGATDAASQLMEDTFMGSGINLDPTAIQDLSSAGSAERLKRTDMFQLGGGYFFRLGPVNFYAQGGTYDALGFGKLLPAKGGKEAKPSVINIPIRATKNLLDGLTVLRKTFETGRQALTPQQIETMADNAAPGSEIDLETLLQYQAPKQGFRIDASYVIAGETVPLPKDKGSFEAITFCRLPKATGNNGKGTGKYSLSFPLRFLPILQTLVEYSMGQWAKE